jgi:hypothetical protein
LCYNNVEISRKGLTNMVKCGIMLKQASGLIPLSFLCVKIFRRLSMLKQG